MSVKGQVGIRRPKREMMVGWIQVAVQMKEDRFWKIKSIRFGE